MSEWYAKVEGIYRQSREHRQGELIEAARWAAREEAKNPYLKEDERKAIQDYGYFGALRGFTMEIANTYEMRTEEETCANAAFIAAADPQTILSLLDRVKSLELELEAMKNV